MDLLNLPLPVDEAGSLRWEGFWQPWIAPMAECMQDPVFHAEGDVWTHTRMVCEAAVELPEYAELSEGDRAVLLAAALLHDIAKPQCTLEEGGRIKHPNHSVRGSIVVRKLLWELDVPFAVREQVCALIRFHQVPFFLINDADPVRQAARVSQTARCDLLGLLTRADGLGRICPDLETILENVALFDEYCREQGCREKPWAFASEHSRFLYFRKPERDAAYHAYDDTRCEVVMLSGLPGAGKSHWIEENLDLPVVSLDAIREELRIGPLEGQGPVIERARAQAKEYLRRGESFAWNATNLSRDIRARQIDLFADYNARIRIVYVEASRERLLRQNREREEMVPEAVIERMTRNWEVPNLTEAHAVDYVTV